MQIETACLLFVMVTCGTYLILDRGLVRIVFGFTLLSNAANVFLISLSLDPTGKTPPIVTHDGTAMVDPLPQALILTAIVIGFGMTAYLVMLSYRILSNRHDTDVANIFAKDVEDYGP